jgi:hypothetical protein
MMLHIQSSMAGVYLPWPREHLLLAADVAVQYVRSDGYPSL